ncbi:MAG: hypothetical protein GY944_09480 [bacterium]|nr:hypothetical protein [bacterium]
MENSDPIDGVPRGFRNEKYLRSHLAYGSEYEICDLNGDGVTDLVMSNLLSKADSPRMRREPGRILIYDRRLNDDGSKRTRIRKVRADFMDNMNEFVETHATCGDIDGDGLQELIVTSGKGGGNRLQIIDDVRTGFASFRLPGSRKGVMRVARDILGAGGNGEMLAATGDVDDDGLEEVIVSFKRPLADQILILDDADHDLEPMDDPQLDSGYVMNTNSRKSNFRGKVKPVAVDLDEDGVVEILKVYANSDEVSYEMFDDASESFAPID